VREKTKSAVGLQLLFDPSPDPPDEIEVMNINDLCRAVFTRTGGVCIFVDCMGTTFAVGPAKSSIEMPQRNDTVSQTS
jgi:hypothetical protein